MALNSTKMDVLAAVLAMIGQSSHAALLPNPGAYHDQLERAFEIMRDILKIASGVFLGMLAFWIVTTLVPSLVPASQKERAAQDLLDRQFAPSH